MAFDGTDAPKPEGSGLPPCPFMEGDLVHLKSGGPQLVVGCVEDEFVLEVHWFDGAVLRVTNLPYWCFSPCIEGRLPS